MGWVSYEAVILLSLSCVCEACWMERFSQQDGGTRAGWGKNPREIKGFM